MVNLLHLLLKQQRLRLNQFKEMHGLQELIPDLPAQMDCSIGNFAGAGYEIHDIYGMFEEGWVIAKTKGSFLHDEGECQRADFRWFSNYIAEISQSEIKEDFTGDYKMGPRERIKRGRRVYARTVTNVDESTENLFFHAEGDFEENGREISLDAKLSEELYGEAGAYNLRYLNTTSDGHDMMLIQGCHAGFESNVFICSDRDCDIESQFSDIEAKIGTDFNDVALNYVDNFAPNCLHDNDDTFCDPCFGREDCWSLIDCNEESIVFNKEYADIDETLGNDYFLTMDIKVLDLNHANYPYYWNQTIMPIYYEGIFTLTLDNDGDIRQPSASYNLNSYNLIPTLFDNCYDGSNWANSYGWLQCIDNHKLSGDLGWFTVTTAMQSIAGNRRMFRHLGDGKNGPVDYVIGPNGNNDPGEHSFRELTGLKIYGGDPMPSVQAFRGKVKNARFQKGSMNRIMGLDRY